MEEPPEAGGRMNKDEEASRGREEEGGEGKERSPCTDAPCTATGTGAGKGRAVKQPCRLCWVSNKQLSIMAAAAVCQSPAPARHSAALIVIMREVLHALRLIVGVLDASADEDEEGR